MADTSSGKAFEYACVRALDRKYNKSLNGNIVVEVSENAPYKTAESKFKSADAETQCRLVAAADAAVKMLDRLEPKLGALEDTPLVLTIQADSAGQKGDVRDIVCTRGKWELGLSCKHNHAAVKNPRLSATIDFGQEWTGHPVSDEYWKEVKPIFEELDKIQKESNKKKTWSELDNKDENYYVPVLKAFTKELKRLNDSYDDVAEKAVNYLLGNRDFYKIITVDPSKITRIEAVNIQNTLGRKAGKNTAKPKPKKVKLPNKILGIEMPKYNTVHIYCNEGWSFKLRIHSASKIVQGSMKFDAELISAPVKLHSEVQPWHNEYHSE